jgi:hypothetical protein
MSKPVNFYGEFEPSLLTLRETNPIETKEIPNEKNTYLSVIIRYSGVESPHFELPRLVSKMFMDDESPKKGGDKQKIEKKESSPEGGNKGNQALLCDVVDPKFRKFLDDLIGRCGELLEPHRNQLGFTGKKWDKLRVHEIINELYKVKPDASGKMDPDKPPGCFLRIKPWTRLYTPAGIEIEEPDRSKILRSQLTFIPIVKLHYIYCGGGKLSLQWYIDELTVYKTEARERKQTKTRGHEEYLRENPDADDKFILSFEEVKRVDEENRRKLDNVSKIPEPPSEDIDNDIPEDFTTAPAVAKPITIPTPFAVPTKFNLKTIESA